MGDQLLKLRAHLLKSESGSIFCDGDFSLANYSHGNQFIALSAISVCIDEDGWVIASSFGKELQPDEIQRKAAELFKSIEKKNLDAAVYESSSHKDVDGSSSSDQKKSNGASRQ